MSAQVRVWDPALGRERAATVDELVQINGGRVATPAPMLPGWRPLPPPAPPKTPSERLAATMAQARAWSLDPSVSAADRRKLSRCVAAYDAARAQRADGAKLRSDFEALESKAKALRLARKEAREAERRAEPLRRTEAHRRAWAADPHGMAIKSLAALNQHNPTEDQIRHAMACAGYP